MSRPLAIVGPTASGKSDVAMALAAAIGSCEIVAVDAMQVYRGMDIGTGKPTAADRSAVRHHGLDLVDPSERFTVADYQRAASDALAAIRARQSTAVLVAGTGLYLTAVIDELTLPGEWPELRAELTARAAQPGGLAALEAELRELDAAAAARIEPGNERRIVRALEVCLGSGRPFSSFGPGTGRYPPIDTEQFGLRWERRALRERIARRVHAMVDAGWLDEVRGLLARPGGLSRTARQALGYGELIDVAAGRVSLADAVATTIVRTQQFAVRQSRWFGRDPRIRWIDITEDPVEEALDVIRRTRT